MHSILHHAIFLKDDKKSFKNNNGETIEYHQVHILDEKLNLHICGRNMADVDLELPEESLTEGTAEILIEEREGKVKKYIINWE